MFVSRGLFCTSEFVCILFYLAKINSVNFLGRVRMEFGSDRYQKQKPEHDGARRAIRESCRETSRDFSAPACR